MCAATNSDTNVSQYAGLCQEDGEKPNRFSRTNVWIFKYDNWTVEGRDAMITLFKKTSRWFVLGEETDASDTPFLQGSVYFKTSQSLDYVKKINNTIQWRCMNPDVSCCRQIAAYCKKGEQSKDEWIMTQKDGPNYGKNAKITEWGKCPQPSTAFNLRMLKFAIISGKTVEELIRGGHSLARKHKKELDEFAHLLAYEEFQRENERWQPVIDWHYGENATECERKHRDKRISGVWIQLNISDWKKTGCFQGYTWQENVVINDVNEGDIDYDTLVSWFSNKPCRIPVGNGESVSFAPANIIITSQNPPTEIYRHEIKTNGSYRLLKNVHVFEWNRCVVNDKTTCVSRTKEFRALANENEWSRYLAASLSASSDDAPYMIECVWIYGMTGVGKTHLALDGLKHDAYYRIYNRTIGDKWWGKYNKKDVVILDNCSKDFKLRHDVLVGMLSLRQSQTSRTSGGKRLIITSLYHPDCIYPNEDNTMLHKRIKIVHLQVCKDIGFVRGKNLGVFSIMPSLIDLGEEDKRYIIDKLAEDLQK